jgi:type II secretory pathway predicted ATPase ExeA
MKLSRLELLAEFGFKRDPFRGVSLETEDMRRLSAVLNMAIDAHEMIAVVGSRGSGKSVASERVLSGRKCRVVRICAADKERLTIGDIELSLIYGLSDEKPRRSRISRGWQVRKILTIASLKSEIVILIEEAHRIHGQTLRSLKTLREPEGGGEPQFTVIFAGQFNFLETKKGLDEVRLRSDVITLNGLTVGESAEYLKLTVGKVFEEDALEFAAKAPTADNFLDLKEIAFNLMEHAYLEGRQRVTAEDVRALFISGGVKAEKRDGSANLKKLLGSNDKQGVAV